jgi:predicted transcriptional regulator
MIKKKNNKPTSAELEILQILWESGSSTVKEVNENLSKKRKVGYTTTLKMMQIMFEKGLLNRKKDGRSHVYSAASKQRETENALIDKVLETAFGGSASRLVIQALGRSKTSEKELNEIKEYIKQLEREKDNA